jgi:3-deoxy-D-manno-octulosonic-acid transferase
VSIAAPVIGLYRGLGAVLEPFASMFLSRRLKAGKEDGARLRERLGHAALARPEGRLVWLHAASVGETISVLPLVEALARHATVLLTTGTITSADLAGKRLPAGAIHQFVPLDLPRAGARFLDHWRPDMAILAESELWPGLMQSCARRGIPLGIVNGRMSDRSFRRWQKLHGTARALLSPLAFCLAQSDIDSARYAELGAPAISPGNLKFDVPALPFSTDERDTLRARLGSRPVLLAASTHPGEEAEVIAAAALVREREPDLLTIIVPRHPQRGEEIANLCAGGGISASRRSLGALPGPADVIHIADTLGELGLFFALADLAFIGGSLVPHGGHNPIEAVKLGAPVLSGPHVSNFTFVFDELRQENAFMEIADAAALAAVTTRLLASRDERQALAARASAAFARHEGALARTLDVVLPLLAEGKR